jgi:hypothetical protein
MYVFLLIEARSFCKSCFLSRSEVLFFKALLSSASVSRSEVLLASSMERFSFKAANCEFITSSGRVVVFPVPT